MPRFFFHIYDDAVALDEDGLELADADAARTAALVSARALMCDQLRQGQLHLDHRIEVEDDKGEAVFSLRFADAVEIKGEA